MKNKKWKHYHKTREVLVQAIDNHYKSIGLVNVYNNGFNKDIPLNTSGDYTLMNEHMGTIEMALLKRKLTV